MRLVGHFATFPLSENDFLIVKYLPLGRNYVAKSGTMF
jgi:hypothetical protein